MVLAVITLAVACSTRTPDSEPLEWNPGDARVSYLGPEGTYTEEATQLVFPDSAVLVPRATVPDAIADVVSGASDYAVIPQENTIGGPVTAYVDALIAEQAVFVVGEVIIPISQTLMGLPGASLSDIRLVCSHAQGLAQSAQWLGENLPEAETVEKSSTAAAASFVAESGDGGIAAIAAPGAAKLYGLEVLAENVQISDSNRTRFYILSANAREGEGLTNAVLVATCGADMVDDVIIEISRCGLELVSIHDRPEGSRLGSYHFIMEVNDPDGIGVDVLRRLESLSDVRLLGSFNVVR